MNRNSRKKGKNNAKVTRQYRDFVIKKLNKKGIYKADKKQYNGVFSKNLNCHDSKFLYTLYFNTFGSFHNEDCGITAWSHILEKIADKDSTYVYVMANIDNEICKIGHSTNPLKRVKEVQTGCPYKLDLIFMIKGSPALEKKLHIKYSKLRMNGEWFSFKDELKSNILNATNNILNEL